MEEYVLYPGCLLQTEQYGYEISLRNLLAQLDVQIVNVNNFSCCGAPFRSINRFLTIYLCARNLAIASEQNCPILIPCPQCHLAFTDALQVLKSTTVIEKVNKFLADENLKFDTHPQIVHPLELLYDKVGTQNLQKFINKKIQLNAAVHYGCQLLRPSKLGRPDDSEAPSKLDVIIEQVGIKSIDYAEKLNCCGGMIFSSLPESALTKTGQKVAAIQKYNVDCIITACPWCHRMFDTKQESAAKIVGVDLNTPVLYFTQILCIAFQIDVKKTGLEFNLSATDKLQKIVSV